MARAIQGVGGGSGLLEAGASGRAGPPKAVTKDDLVQMRDRLAKEGGKDTAGLDKLIAKFDEAAGQNGKLSASQFKDFAEANGVSLPKPGRAGGPPGAGGTGGARGASSARGATAAGDGGKARGTKGSSSTSSTNSSSEDYSTKSEADLRQEAAQGDTKAVRELARREAAAARRRENEAVDTVDADRFGPGEGAEGQPAEAPLKA